MSALLTSAELVLRRVPGHVIPPMTDPMGQHWDQPDRFQIEIDETHAMMSQATFDALRNYSHSQPSGVYPGKMWKWVCRGTSWCRCPKDSLPYLKWFGEEFDKDGVTYCRGGSRIILIV